MFYLPIVAYSLEARIWSNLKLIKLDKNSYSVYIVPGTMLYKDIFVQDTLYVMHVKSPGLRSSSFPLPPASTICSPDNLTSTFISCRDT